MLNPVGSGALSSAAFPSNKLTPPVRA